MSDPIQIEKKLISMATEAELLGAAKQASIGMEGVRKARRAEAFLRATGSVAERTAISECDPDYLDAYNEQAKAAGEYARLHARHKIGEQWIMVQQSLMRIDRQAGRGQT